MGDVVTTEKEKEDHITVQEQTEGCASGEGSPCAEPEAVQPHRARGGWKALGCILLAAVLLLSLGAYGFASGTKEPEAQPDAAADDAPEKLEELPEEDPEETAGPEEALPEEEETPLEEQEEQNEPEPAVQTETASVSSHGAYSQEALDQVVQEVLNSIISKGMTKREQARAVWDYTRTHVMYTGTSDKSDWKQGAYTGLTTRRGDCFTYYAVSRALLTALGIDNLEVQRVGGPTSHYWNLVNCGDGWYHFDATPRSSKMPYFVSFMFTDQQAADYTARAGRNYYTFDGSLYPARAGGSATTSTPEKTPAAPEPAAAAGGTESAEPQEPVSETPSEGEPLPDSTTPSDGETVPDEAESAEAAPLEEETSAEIPAAEGAEDEADGGQESPD